MRGVYKREEEKEGKQSSVIGEQFYFKEKWFYTHFQTKQCKIANRGKQFSRKMYYPLSNGASVDLGVL